jgi:antibiotic biosynthesis monooxygenase (ABM) superfamily enzyme
MLRKFGSVTALIAFINSPTGQKMLGKAKEVVTDPRNQQKAADFVSKLKRPSTTRPGTATERPDPGK